MLGLEGLPAEDRSYCKKLIIPRPSYRRTLLSSIKEGGCASMICTSSMDVTFYSGESRDCFTTKKKL